MEVVKPPLPRNGKLSSGSSSTATGVYMEYYPILPSRTFLKPVTQVAIGLLQSEPKTTKFITCECVYGTVRMLS
jgi:hypothetical protein